MAVRLNGYTKWVLVAFAVITGAITYGQLVASVSNTGDDVQKVEVRVDKLERCSHRVEILLERICTKMEISTKVNVE